MHSESHPCQADKASLGIYGQHGATNNPKQNDTEGDNGGFWKLDTIKLHERDLNHAIIL